MWTSKKEQESVESPGEIEEGGGKEGSLVWDGSAIVGIPTGNAVWYYANKIYCRVAKHEKSTS